MNYFLAFLIFVTHSAQVLRIPGPGGAPSGGGGGTSWDSAPICHGALPGNGSSALITVGPLNCSGATDYKIQVTEFGSGAATASCSYNDGSSHSFTLHSIEVPSSASNSTAIQYAEGITGSASVTFSCTTNYGSIWVQGWKYGKSSGSLDQQDHSGPTCYACVTATITPTQNNTLVFIAASCEAAGTCTPTSTGYTFLDAINFNGGV